MEETHFEGKILKNLNVNLKLTLSRIEKVK